jgi:hypothetical protein
MVIAAAWVAMRGKKVTGRKQHILTLGLLLSVAVHPASIQDRDGRVVQLTFGHRSRVLPSFAVGLGHPAHLDVG